MTLEIVSFTLGPVMTNSYLVADQMTGAALVIDPAWDGRTILDAATQRGWSIGQLWYTHAHFDHIGGAAELAAGLAQPPEVVLHQQDHSLWQLGGGGAFFGYKIDPGPEPSVQIEHGQVLKLGGLSFEVRHTPGHTPGHVIYYCAAGGVLFSGDLIFQQSVGRTDLPGGNTRTLLESIRNQVFSLPDETRILSGHGYETTVGEERHGNPFVTGWGL